MLKAFAFGRWREVLSPSSSTLWRQRVLTLLLCLLSHVSSALHLPAPSPPSSSSPSSTFLILLHLFRPQFLNIRFCILKCITWSVSSFLLFHPAPGNILSGSLWIPAPIWTGKSPGLLTLSYFRAPIPWLLCILFAWFSYFERTHLLKSSKEKGYMRSKFFETLRYSVVTLESSFRYIEHVVQKSVISQNLKALLTFLLTAVVIVEMLNVIQIPDTLAVTSFLYLLKLVGYFPP